MPVSIFFLKPQDAQRRKFEISSEKHINAALFKKKSCPF
jgi:hypothetical protein